MLRVCFGVCAAALFLTQALQGCTEVPPPPPEKVALTQKSASKVTLSKNSSLWTCLEDVLQDPDDQSQKKCVIDLLKKAAADGLERLIDWSGLTTSVLLKKAAANGLERLIDWSGLTTSVVAKNGFLTLNVTMSPVKLADGRVIFQRSKDDENGPILLIQLPTVNKSLSDECAVDDLFSSSLVHIEGYTSISEIFSGQDLQGQDVTDLKYSKPPISVPAGTLYSEGISCGPDPMNVFDIYLPKSPTKTPLIVYIHGGGFTGGDKQNNIRSKADEVTAMLNAGVAFAAINYRLLDHVDDTGVRKPLEDSRYCLQFMRHHHDVLNIEKDKVAAYGGSAGAGTALWLGSHDDMKNDASPDPVEHESTRLRAVAISETQATYDILRWLDIFTSYSMTMEEFVAIQSEQRILSFYGIDDMAQLQDSTIATYRADVDMLALMDKDDAPVWIESTKQKETEPVDTAILFHHPYHARAVMNQAASVGLVHVAKIPELGIQDANSTERVDFLLRYLN